MTPFAPARARVFTALLLSPCLASCARDDMRTGSDTAAAADAQVTAAVGAAPIDTVRAPAGTWSLGLAENKLRSARLAPVQQAGDVRRPGFVVPGVRYALGDAQLELFLYADAVARGRDTDMLDVARIAPVQSARPALITDGNLAALLFTTDAALLGRVRAALRTEADDGPLEPAGVVPPRGAPERAP